MKVLRNAVAIAVLALALPASGHAQQATSTFPQCMDLIEAFFDCVLAVPSEGWECEESGGASISDGTCDQAEGAMQSCFGQ